jgi:peptidoglycan hydrolase-like protein with peptidoglycan-binding domain
MPAVRLDHLRMGSRDSCVGVFQTALKNKGYDPGPIDGVYGNVTKGACQRFQKAQGWTGSGADGLPGPATAQRLGLSLITGSEPTKPSTPTKATTSNYRTLSEPSQDMTRTTYGGKTVNKRTKVLLQRAAEIYGANFTLTQGSYNRGGVAASAGTHDGGGVVDISVSSMSASQRAKAVQALRMAGFAAWLRTPAEGFAYHIHACAIGDKEMASLAKNQVQSYFNGRSGLVSNRRVTDPLHWPDWADKYNR